VIDGQGNLYGVTAYGGTGDCVLLGVSAGCGTVYELSAPAEKGGAWKETILYSFPTAKQGYFPNGNLVFDGAGNLYGATTYGGGKGTTCDAFYGGNCGTVFKLSPPKTKGGNWTEKVLHSFAGGTDGAILTGDWSWAARTMSTGRRVLSGLYPHPPPYSAIANDKVRAVGELQEQTSIRCDITTKGTPLVRHIPRPRETARGVEQN
jgi:hypothetical protein